MNIALDIVTVYNYNNALSSIVRRDTNVSGVNPRRPVTHEELAQHNTRYVQVSSWHPKFQSCLGRVAGSPSTAWYITAHHIWNIILGVGMS